MMDVPRIKKLDEEVVNRIAAGEVIQRPANAIKELMENSIDAKSTGISIIVKNGGLKFVQIKDNGHGIKKDDLPIVCERFTTSKLSTFEDLKRITTHGFRGEALASISHIAHLTIITMTENDNCAWKASYRDGKVAGRPGEGMEITPTAGVKGTQITIEDMFYNVSSRRKTLTKPNEEYIKIVDIVTKYALHNAGISFSLKKKDENTTDVHTLKTNSVKDNIRSLYTPTVARELIEVNFKDEKLGQLDGFITNPNYHKRKGVFILFINHRLVDCRPLKKSIEALYAPYIPKGNHPFLYFSLQLDPVTVDVNIHPTKSEVRFLHQDEIIDKVKEIVIKKLEETNQSRTFHDVQQHQTTLVVVDMPTNPTKASTTNTPVRPTPQNKMVRTDHREQTLDAFFEPNRNNTDPNKDGDEVNDDDVTVVEDVDDEMPDQEKEKKKKKKSVSGKKSSQEGQNKNSNGKRTHNLDDDIEDFEQNPASKIRKKSNTNVVTVDGNDTEDVLQTQTQKSSLVLRKPISSQPKKRKKPLLTSIQNLLNDVKEVAHANLSIIFKNYSFVGCVNENLALIQHQTELYLCNVCNLSKELIYQECLQNFAEFDYIKLSSPAPIHTLCMLALDAPTVWCPEDGPKEAIATYIVELLVSRRTMLQEYFRMTIDEQGQLLTLPQIIPNYTPEIGALSTFILRLSTEVEWDEEQACFETLSREFAEFYCLQFDEEMVDIDDIQGAKENTRFWTVEHIFFPAFRQRFLPPQSASEDGSIIRIASMEKLYKVFERC